MGAGGGAAGGIAKVGAAAEGAGVVDLTAMVFEKGASAIGLLGRDGLATAGSPCFCGEHRFASGEIGRFSGEGKVATLRDTRAVPLQWAFGEFAIDGAHLIEQREGGRGIRQFRHGAGVWAEMSRGHYRNS